VIAADPAHRRKYCSPQCKSRALAVRWRAKAPGYMREYNYGLSDERYQALLASQGGVCAACGTAEWGGRTGNPNVDHDHGCNHPGKGALSCPDCVRGLLCDFCNRGLGMFSEDPAQLRAAADYLEKAIAWCTTGYSSGTVFSIAT